jgi:hypothetical protein
MNMDTNIAFGVTLNNFIQIELSIGTLKLSELFDCGYVLNSPLRMQSWNYNYNWASKLAIEGKCKDLKDECDKEPNVNKKKGKFSLPLIELI